MKLLSLSINGVNDNITYFDGESLKYFKLERKMQVKIAGYKDYYNGWKRDLKEHWGVEIEDIDKVALMSCNYFCP